jgi:tetratricopeptide (TPR) repeat protein
MNSGPFDPGRALSEAQILHRQGKLRDAEKLYGRVLKAVPDNFDTLSLLGAVKAQLGNMGEAQRLFSAAVKINPGSAGAWSNLGQTLYMLKRASEAIECLDKARTLAPDDVSILYQHANLLLALDRAQEAADELRAVLARAPQHADSHINYGLALAKLEAPEQALAAFDAGLALAPNHPTAHFNRGLALLELGHYAEAIAANERALAANPDHAGAWLNRGRALSFLKQYEGAIESYRKALAARKDYAEAHYNESLALLTAGDYRAGFEKYEWRWRRTGMPAQKSRGRPLWLGEYPLARKTILLHAEQGLGDTIPFARYVPMVAAMGAKVVLEVQPELRTLMRGLSGISEVIARDEKPPPFDVHCPLGSLPLAMKTEFAGIPAQIPYLSADEAHLAKWSPRIEALPRPRIAFAWSGNAAHVNDRNRSLSFARFASMLAGDASFISVQRDVRAEDAADLAAAAHVTHLGGELEDFGDTVAVLALCDLLIAVDTSVVHLAGAMGRPVWVLVPFAPDFRWTRDGDTTPWYPAARLFRQPSPGDWDSVIARVRGALAHFIGENAAGR